MVKTGWFRESYRHSLAARGVTTNRTYMRSKLGKYKRIAESLQGKTFEPTVGPGDVLEAPVPASAVVRSAVASVPAERPPSKVRSGVGATTLETARELKKRDWYDQHPVDKQLMLTAKRSVDELNEKLKTTENPEEVKDLNKRRAAVMATLIEIDNRATKEVDVVSPGSKAMLGVTGEEKSKMGSKYLEAMEEAKRYQEKAAASRSRLEEEKGAFKDFESKKMKQKKQDEMVKQLKELQKSGKKDGSDDQSQ